MFGPYDTMEQLKARYRSFRAEEKQKITNEVRTGCQGSHEKHEFEVPEALVEKQLSVLVEIMKNNLRQEFDSGKNRLQ
jgi:FKBP-type peptidyl-prolyl cis-trans isomerase (trigger factor)